jgi:hypothetical protein
MNRRENYSIYDPNSPYYDYTVDEPDPNVGKDGCGGVVLAVGGVSLLLAFVWDYVGPVFYTVFYVIDLVIHLFNPAWPVKWMGDSSTYTLVVSGLTALVLAYGAYRLVRLAWRVIQFFRKD